MLDKYSPLPIEGTGIEELLEPQHPAFLIESAILPGLKLVLDRHRARPDWPFIDTKFNPNTGAELGPESYSVVYSWFLGRGTEALSRHLDCLDSLQPDAGLACAATEIFPELISAMTAAMRQTAHRYNGRCPFRLNRQLEAVDKHGRVIEPDLTILGAGDLFCAKGLLCSPDPEVREQGCKLLIAAAQKVRENRYSTEQAAHDSSVIPCGPRMLWQAIPALLRHPLTASARQVVVAAIEFSRFVLHRHYDRENRTFSEYLEPPSLARKPLLDPGHCNEFIGLALQAVAAIRTLAPDLAAQEEEHFRDLEKQLPQMLLGSFAVGFNHSQEGIFKLVNTTTGQPVDANMPWWNLPETMRAALRAWLVCGEEGIRAQCLDVYAWCHNAYFRHYLNPGMELFPFQTRCGSTGRVVDLAPSIPEGDPLYHSNLCFLDILGILRRLARH